MIPLLGRSVLQLIENQFAMLLEYAQRPFERSRRHPRAVVHVVSADPTALIDRELRQRNIELAITWTPQPSSHDDLNIENLFDDRPILMAGTKSRWVHRRKITWADLIKEPWILPPPDSALGSYIAERFRAAGLEPPHANVAAPPDARHRTLRHPAFGINIAIHRKSAAQSIAA